MPDRWRTSFLTLRLYGARGRRAGMTSQGEAR